MAIFWKYSLPGLLHLKGEETKSWYVSPKGRSYWTNSFRFVVLPLYHAALAQGFIFLN